MLIAMQRNNNAGEYQGWDLNPSSHLEEFSETRAIMKLSLRCRVPALVKQFITDGLARIDRRSDET
jgi:hypothetical protein